MKQNPHTFDQAPDSVTLEPAAAQAQGKHRIFHHDHPLIVQAKIRNGHLVLSASWRDDDDDDADYDNEEQSRTQGLSMLREARSNQA